MNGVDPLGQNFLSKAWDDTGGKLVHGIKVGAPTAWRDVVDVPQDVSYLAYWGSYEGIVLVPLEAAGLAGQGLGSLAKGESVWLEGVPNQPLLGNQVVFGIHFRQVNKDLGLPFLTFPGYDATPSHHMNFAW